MQISKQDHKYDKMDNYMEKIKDYDEEIQSYYYLRHDNKPFDKFSSQVAGGLKKVNTKRREIVNAIVDQGYNLSLKTD